MTVVNDESMIVEAFDEPYVADEIEQLGDKWLIHLPYQLSFEFPIESLSLDEWDRFHGYTKEKKIPFVMSRNAQDEFFNLLQEFDDESITFEGRTYKIPAYFESRPQFQEPQRWSQAYQTGGDGWELNQPAPALIDNLPKLKLPRSRILVLGCGTGNDAAFFAESGHVVTAVDFAPEAINSAKKKYANLSNIKWIESDIFKLPSEMHGQFDLIFEHTCFCAVNPTQRKSLVDLWSRLLIPSGFLMGIFFTMERKEAAPFGATEWEIRERLKNKFRTLEWRRWKKSIPERSGKELFVLAQRK